MEKYIWKAIDVNNGELLLLLCSWWCYCGATFLLFWLILVVCHLIGGLWLMRREERLTLWMVRSLVLFRLTRIKEYDFVGSATSLSLLVAIIVLFVSFRTKFLVSSWLRNSVVVEWCVRSMFLWFQVDAAYLRWTITVFGLLIVLGPWITSTSYFSWYVFFDCHICMHQWLLIWELLALHLGHEVYYFLNLASDLFFFLLSNWNFCLLACN